MTEHGGNSLENRYNKHTAKDLNVMQTWPLSRKILATQARIIEWYQHYDGMVYVSFSGGKDSTVLLDIVRRIYPDVPAVFCDTGLEYPEVRKFALSQDNVIRLKPKMTFREVIEKYGYPVISKEVAKKTQGARNKPDGYDAKYFDPTSLPNLKYGGRYALTKWSFLLNAPFKVSDRCCNAMKKNPAKQYEHESNRHPILGTMAQEGLYRKNNWFKNGCNAFDTNRPTSQPMSFWTENDVLEYLHTYNIPYAPVYGDIVPRANGGWTTTGCNRTGCVFCAFGAHLEKEPNRFQRLKVTHPKLWHYCMKPWDEGGLGMKEVLDYIGVKYE